MVQIPACYKFVPGSSGFFANSSVPHPPMREGRDSPVPQPPMRKERESLTNQPPTGEGRVSPAAGKDLSSMAVSLTSPTLAFEDLESQLKSLGVYCVVWGK